MNGASGLPITLERCLFSITTTTTWSGRGTTGADGSTWTGVLGSLACGLRHLVALGEDAADREQASISAMLNAGMGVRRRYRIAALQLWAVMPLWTVPDDPVRSIFS